MISNLVTSIMYQPPCTPGWQLKLHHILCEMVQKAFDTVKHSTLFSKLLDQGMPCIVVRYLLISYRLQQANVRWRNEVSDFFPVSNGVKQGSVLSAILYCVYTNGLFENLRI